MKKVLSFLILLSISFGFTPQTFANTNEIKRKDAFIFFANYYAPNVPDSFQYIDLKFTDVAKDSTLEDALQILVYLDLLQNSETKIVPHAKVDIYTFEKLAEKIIDIKVSSQQTELDKRSTYTTYADLKSISTILIKRNLEKETEPGAKIKRTGTADDLWTNSEILFDVFKTLKKSHYDKDELSNNKLVEWAIKGMTDSVWDRYTTYFPPVESEDFFEGLEGEFEWIGAYVDMPAPGEMIIISPIVWSPAEKSGLQWGDRITHVDGIKISADNSLREVISWIKGPAGTEVILTIERKGKNNPFDVSVTRDKIIIKDVEHKLIDSETFYIQIKNFWNRADSEFKTALEALQEKESVKKIIFDLRNNPGGYLWEVSTILSYAVPKGEATAIVSTGNDDLAYRSLGYEIVDFSDYEMIFLQNGGTASASEIMIGTMKDYYPESKIIWVQSFWKGSVQSLKAYKDGSTLKYTTAKWFTGKNRVGIDGVGITPDTVLEFDTDRWNTYEKDNQLEEALKQ